MQGHATFLPKPLKRNATVFAEPHLGNLDSAWVAGYSELPFVPGEGLLEGLGGLELYFLKKKGN